MDKCTSKFIIWLKESAYIAMLEDALVWGLQETGGILIGYWGTQTDVVITKLVGPGPKAVHMYDAFIPDNKFHINEISKIYNATDRIETYLGDWHTHPKSSSYLSAKDKKTINKIANFKSARLLRPLMLVLGTNPLELNGWLHDPEVHEAITLCKIKMY